MQLFNRRVSVVGPPAETVAYLTDMQAFVSGKSGRDIGLWAGSFGAPQGTFVFSTAVEGLADLAAVTDQLASDPEYHEKLAAGAAYNGAPAEDTLSDVLHGEVGNRPPVGSVVSVTSVLIGNGAYSAAIGWGVEMAQFAASVSGIATIFTMDATGDFGRVNWLAVAPDAAATDAGFAALNADPDYIKRLDAAGDLFQPGTGTRSIATRIA